MHRPARHRLRPHRAGSSARRRLLATLVVAGTLVVGTATPAAADPAAPTDFLAEVTAIEPATPGVAARMLGGDSFLELTVDRGREVVVLGYRDEPYLRFRPDGTVERNVRSPATYLNDDRFGDAPMPPTVDPAAEPDWEQVATGGSYAWHDHRAHWMQAASPDVPRGERIGGEYDPWRVPLVVDGEPVVVLGTLTYAAEVSPLPWFGLAVVAAAGLVLAGRRAPLGAGAGALAAISVLAVLLGRDEYGVSPAGAGANPLQWMLPVGALAAAAGALVLVAVQRRSAAVVLTLGSVAALSGWALLRIATLLRPVLPTSVPAPVDRAGVALALGAAAGAAWLAVTSGALALPDLDDLDDVHADPGSDRSAGPP